MLFVSKSSFIKLFNVCVSVTGLNIQHEAEKTVQVQQCCAICIFPNLIKLKIYNRSKR